VAIAAVTQLLLPERITSHEAPNPLGTSACRAREWTDVDEIHTITLG